MEHDTKGKEIKKQASVFHPQVIESLLSREILGSSHPKDKKIKVKLYDFTRPDKFSRDQIRTLAIIHETFARLASTSFAVLLRYVCELHVEMVDQMTFGEYIEEIPDLTTMGIINMDPLMGSALMQINNTLTFPIIERLAGRTEVETPGYNRDMTDIEMSLMEKIFVRLLGNLREGWSTVMDLKPRLGQIETNPQFVQIVPPNEMVIMVVFKCKVHTVESRMTLCLPYLTIEPIVAKLSAQYWYSFAGKNKSPRKVFPVSGFKADSLVFYESEKISLNSLHNLSRGSLIKIPDFKKGKAYLSCGKEHLLQLKAEKRKGPHQSYKIITGTITHDNEADGFLFEINRNTDKTQAQQAVDTMKEVLDSYEDKLSQRYSTIEKTLKEFTRKQDEIADQLYFGSKDKELQEVEPDENTKPFQFLHSFEIDHIFNFIRQEHPQIIALILAYIEPYYSSELLQKFQENLQIDIAQRIATLDRTHPDILHAIEMVLKGKLVRTEKIITAGGIDSIVEILHLTSRGVEKTILNGLENSDSTLARSINKKMFLFENLRFLDSGAIKILLEKTDLDDMILALKGTTSDVQEHILNCMNEKDKEAARKSLKEIGPVRVQETETARQRIMEMVQNPENEGVIPITTTGEGVE